MKPLPLGTLCRRRPGASRAGVGGTARDSRAPDETLAMPEFAATIITLMGISSGTYVGFTFAEKK